MSRQRAQGTKNKRERRRGERERERERDRERERETETKNDTCTCVLYDIRVIYVLCATYGCPYRTQLAPQPCWLNQFGALS